jgi:galactokinase
VNFLQLEENNMTTVLDALNTGKMDTALQLLYGVDPHRLETQKQRYASLIRMFKREFLGDRVIELFSTPGRTEVGGNHTDHNAGRILAAAVDLDIVAAVAVNKDGIIRIRSEKFPSVEVNIAELAAVESEQFTPTSLVRGVCARLVQLGYQIGGFDAFTSSNVPNGAGLSSSAAFEVLIVTILNHLFNDGVIDDVLNAQIAQYAENEYFGKPCGLMDQTTCSVGGLVNIDFKDFKNPIVHKVDYDFASQGFSIVIVAVGGNHADLNDDYIALEHEMKSTAKAMGGLVLREFSKEILLQNLAAVRAQVSDRGILRAIHFYDDDQRVADQVNALEKRDFSAFLNLIIASGYSSWMLCQNIFSCTNIHDQGLAVALAMSENILKRKGAWRVHGGGFAGTIQAFVPNNKVKEYISRMEAVFGPGSCHQLMIRPVGTINMRKLVG